MSINNLPIGGCGGIMLFSVISISILIILNTLILVWCVPTVPIVSKDQEKKWSPYDVNRLKNDQFTIYQGQNHVWECEKLNQKYLATQQYKPVKRVFQYVACLTKQQYLREHPSIEQVQQERNVFAWNDWSKLNQNDLECIARLYTESYFCDTQNDKIVALKNELKSYENWINCMQAEMPYFDNITEAVMANIFDYVKNANRTLNGNDNWKIDEEINEFGNVDYAIVLKNRAEREKSQIILDWFYEKLNSEQFGEYFQAIDDFLNERIFIDDNNDNQSIIQGENDQIIEDFSTIHNNDKILEEFLELFKMDGFVCANKQKEFVEPIDSPHLVVEKWICQQRNKTIANGNPNRPSVFSVTDQWVTMDKSKLAQIARLVLNSKIHYKTQFQVTPPYYLSTFADIETYLRQSVSLNDSDDDSDEIEKQILDSINQYLIKCIDIIPKSKNKSSDEKDMKSRLVKLIKNYGKFLKLAHQKLDEKFLSIGAKLAKKLKSKLKLKKHKSK